MQALQEQLDSAMTARLVGQVSATNGATIDVADFPAPIGALVEIQCKENQLLEGEVIGFRDWKSIVYPLSSIAGVRRGQTVRLARTTRTLRVGDALLGRVVDARGRCIDGRPQPAMVARARLDNPPPAPADRPRIDAPLATGIRAIDAFLTCGRGQRMGVFAGSGVGKSVLLGMMARRTDADIIVIGLIGERGREVNEFVQRELGPEGLARSVVVVATSDEPAVLRVQATHTATSIAEHFRDQGKSVLLVVDSITRVAHAQREIGLAAGEPPTTRGYPPSVFSLLPRIVERAGRNALGAITAFYSVLVEGDDQSEPIADAVRGLLDGHTWLDRGLASKGHYPAINVLESVSRLMNDVGSREQLDAAATLRELMSVYREHEDVIAIGAYRRGANPRVDLAIDMQDDINAFLRQKVDERVDWKSTQQMLQVLAGKCRARVAAPTTAPHAAPA